MPTNMPAVEPGDLDHVSLVQRIAAGDRAAEADLVSRFQAGVRALIRRHARPADPIVDDLVQDVLHTVIVRLRASALHEPAALPGYVRSVAVFVVTAEYRRRGRRGEDDARSECADALPAPDEPVEQTHRVQLRESVRRVLAELAVERDREVLRRYYLKMRRHGTRYARRCTSIPSISIACCTARGSG